MTTQEALDYLMSIPMFQQAGSIAYNPGTERIEAFCRFLGDPQKRYRTIHVAGTNGKGSVSHMTASLLMTKGFRTGLYTSPHIHHVGERVRVDGVAMNDEQIADFICRAKPFIDEHSPSFFEVTTAMAFDFFAQQGVDAAVIETGLGGRLDATNIITPALSVITNISFDHTAILGDTISKIAAEKAGIIKESVPVVIGESDPESAVVFIEAAHACGSRIVFADKMYRTESVDYHRDGSASYTLSSLLDGYRFTLSSDLGGECQRLNIPTFLTVAEQLREQGLDITKEDIEDALGHAAARTGLTGRWQVLREKPLVVCDTGHNPAGIETVTKQIEAMRQAGLFSELTMVFGVVADKDLEHILPLLPHNARYIFTRPSSARGLDADTLRQSARNHGLDGTTSPDVNAAIKEALETASPDDMIFIGGSSYLVGDISPEYMPRR